MVGMLTALNVKLLILVTVAAISKKRAKKFRMLNSPYHRALLSEEIPHYIKMKKKEKKLATWELSLLAFGPARLGWRARRGEARLTQGRQSTFSNH